MVADVRGATGPFGRSGVWLLRQWWTAWLLLWITFNITSTVFPMVGASDETWASWDAPLQALAALLSAATLLAWIRIVRDISNTQARSAAAQGWTPALALGGPTPAGPPAAPGSPAPGYPWPENVTSALPEDTPAVTASVEDSPVPSNPPTPYAELPSAYLEPPSPYAEPPSPYAEPPSPYAEPPSSYAGVPPPYPGGRARAILATRACGGDDRPSMALGVWAFVLAVLPLFVTWVVAIGLAVAVLLRPNDGWQRGRGLAIAALVISSAWILLGFGLVVAGMTLPDPEVDSVASSKNDRARSLPSTCPRSGS